MGWFGTPQKLNSCGSEMTLSPKMSTRDLVTELCMKYDLIGWHEVQVTIYPFLINSGPHGIEWLEFDSSGNILSGFCNREFCRGIYHGLYFSEWLDGGKVNLNRFSSVNNFGLSVRHTTFLMYNRVRNQENE